jgi:hypothetical protein
MEKQMSVNNILEPIPSNLISYLKKYEVVTLSSTTPPALTNTTNVTFQMDGFGNISACVAAGVGGVTAVSVATANGISGTSSGGTTPALTLSLGAITPSSISLDTTTNAGLLIANTSAGSNAWAVVADASGGLGFNLSSFGTVLNLNTGGISQFSLPLKANAGLTINGGVFTLQAPTTATSATAGTATALPSLPLGYVEIVIAGTTVKLPYYSV